MERMNDEGEKMRKEKSKTMKKESKNEGNNQERAQKMNHKRLKE